MRPVGAAVGMTIIQLAIYRQICRGGIVAVTLRSELAVQEQSHHVSGILTATLTLYVRYGTYATVAQFDDYLKLG